MDHSGYALVQELKDKRNQPLLVKSKLVIEDLLGEVERSKKLVDEQKQLIQIMREGKEYYQGEYKKNTFEEECIKLQQQNNKLNLIVNTYKKGNQELKEHVSKMSGKMVQMEKKIQEQEKVICQSQEKFMALSLQKQILEKEWNKVVKAVNKKIAKIMEKGANNPEFIRDTEYKRIQREETPILDKNAPLNERAEQMIKFLNDRIAIQELQGLFAQKSSEKKGKQKSHQNTPKQRQVLRQINRNQAKMAIGFDF